MKKNISLKFLSLCLALALCAALLGCSPEKAVVGKVDGEAITVQDVYIYTDFFLLEFSMQYSTQITRADLSADDQKSLYDRALDDAVQYKVILKKAKEMNLYPLSGADQKSIDDMAAQYASVLEPYDLTVEDFADMLTREKVEQLAQAEAVKSAAVSDDEAKAEYDRTVAQQKEAFDADGSEFEAAEGDGSTVIAYRPAGYRYVKHILIAMPDDIASQVSDAQAGGDAGKVKELREQGLPQIQAKAEEVLAKVREGGDFDALMAEFGGDPGMQAEPEKTEGYRVGPATGFVQEFKDAALALENVGDVTDLVATDFGYHIIKYVGDAPSGPVAFDDVKDAIRAQALQNKQTELWAAALEQWQAGAKIETHPEKMPLPAATAAAAE
jgi:parvulin-like peptidyl-prolyl isomerase